MKLKGIWIWSNSQHSSTENPEVARILEELVRRTREITDPEDESDISGINLFDYNGNVVGTVIIIE